MQMCSRLDLFGRQWILSRWAARARRLVVSNFANEVNDDIVFLDSYAIKVFPYGQGQALLALSFEPLLAEHCRRMQPNARGLRKDPFVICAREGYRRIYTVLSTVRVKDLSIEGGPRQLRLVISVRSLELLKATLRYRGHRDKPKLNRERTDGATGSGGGCTGAEVGALAMSRA